MRRIKNIMLIALAFLAMACNKEAKKAVTLSGKIENPTGTKLVVYDGDNNLVKTLSLKEDGTFKDTIQNRTGFFMIGYGEQGDNIYLEAGKDLEIAAKGANFYKTLEFTSGSLKEANDLVKKNARIYREKINELGPQRLFSRSEADFMQLIKELDSQNLANITEANVSSEIKDWEKKKNRYARHYLMYVYPLNYRLLKDSMNYQPTQEFLDLQGEITYNNVEDFNQLEIYRTLVMEHFTSRLDNAESEQVTKTILKEIKESPIKQLAKQFAFRLMPTVTDSQTELAKKQEYVKYLTDDPKILAKLDEILADVNSVKPGTDSPAFTYKSIDGKTVSLADLKGKLVYIDVWATWCAPCKAELPHLQKMEKQYHGKNIHFVSISVDENKEAWVNMVKKDKLGGLQLFADKSWKSDFVKGYKIQGIPRFILLDKEGKIVSANAPRPSSKEIKPLINEWLKK